MIASVVIPTYNRPKSLKACLLSLKGQSLKADWEVVIVNDGGEKDLEQILSLFKSTLNITLINQKNQGPATARNHGVKEAKGEHIVFLDDDCEPKSDWLENLVRSAEEGLIIGGRTENKLVNNMCSEASQQLVTFLYYYFENTPWYFFTSNNFLVDRKSFLELGGFDEDFPTSAGEDREICTRWLARGLELKYEPSAIIDHAHQLTLKTFWLQHYKYGKAAVQYRHKATMVGVALPTVNISFYRQLLLFPLKSPGNLFQKLSMMALMFVSQIATFSGYILVKYSKS